MRVVVYSRVSQDRHGDERSPERQEAACRALATARDWTVVEAWRDVDISAFKNLHRPGLEHVLAAIDDGRCDAVCVWKLDRLMRRPRDFEAFWERCENAGVALISVTEPIDTSTELGLAIVRVLVTFASLESATKSVRLRAASRERALRGEPHLMPQAFGYLPGWSDVVPHEAKLVREAAERVLGGETMAGVARDWTLRGLRTRTGAMWTVHRLRDLLTSPRLWGMRTHHGEVVAVGNWPPILTPDTGARLQYLLADPSRRREPNHGRPTLLTGLLRCGKCGSRMVTRRSERGDMTYCCPSTPGGCNGVSVRQAAADAVVVEALMVELEERRNLIPDPVASMPAEEVAQAVASHATALRNAALDFYVRKVIDRSTFLTVRDAVDRSLHEQTVGAPPPPVPAALRSLYQDPRGSWPTMEHVARRAALGACIDHIVIYPSPRSGGRFRPERVEVVFPGQRSTGGPKPRTGDAIDPEWLMTTPEVAEALDLCRETVQRMLTHGHLTGVKTNGHWLVKGADVIACRDLRNIVGVKRVRRSSRKFAEILREYNSRS